MNPDTGGIRGVYPRGLIERQLTSRQSSMTSLRAASAGSTPAASLKLHPDRHGIGGCCTCAGIRGVYPRGLIEACATPPPVSPQECIRGVYPRGLIEAFELARPASLPGQLLASAGSTPAASLKPSPMSRGSCASSE